MGAGVGEAVGVLVAVGKAVGVLVAVGSAVRVLVGVDSAVGVLTGEAVRVGDRVTVAVGCTESWGRTAWQATTNKAIHKTDFSCFTVRESFLW